MLTASFFYWFEKKNGAVTECVAVFAKIVTSEEIGRLVKAV